MVKHSDFVSRKGLESPRFMSVRAMKAGAVDFLAKARLVMLAEKVGLNAPQDLSPLDQSLISTHSFLE
jgi:hypothetical protein